VTLSWREPPIGHYAEYWVLEPWCGTPTATTTQKTQTVILGFLPTHDCRLEVYGCTDSACYAASAISCDAFGDAREGDMCAAR